MDLKTFRENRYAWPGGYAHIGLMGDGECICHKCAKIEDLHEDPELGDGWFFADAFVHWEGDPLFCCHCNDEIFSEYGPIDDERS